MIKNRTGLQSCKHNNLLLEEEIDFCIRKGFKVFEILFDGFWPWDIKSPLRQRIKEISQQKDLTLQVHGPIERREPWEEVLKETLEFTSEIGSKLITLHPQMKDIDIYGNIFSLAEEEGIFIGLENYKEGQIIHSPSDMEKICHFFSDYSNMGITFDPGHANLLTHPVTYLKSLAGNVKILNVHLHDNSGEVDNHLPLGQGNINFSELISFLKSINYEGNFIIEHWHDNLVSADYFSSLWRKVII